MLAVFSAKKLVLKNESSGILVSICEVRGTAGVLSVGHFLLLLLLQLILGHGDGDGLEVSFDVEHGHLTGGYFRETA